MSANCLQRCHEVSISSLRLWCASSSVECLEVVLKRLLPLGMEFPSASHHVVPQGGPDGVKAGDRCVLFKDRGVMVVGLSATEWRLLLEKQAGPRTDIQMISGVEDAVIRGLTQCESMAEAQVELKMSWNHWAAKLCEGAPSATIDKGSAVVRLLASPLFLALASAWT